MKQVNENKNFSELLNLNNFTNVNPEFRANFKIKIKKVNIPLISLIIHMKYKVNEILSLHCIDK